MKVTSIDALDLNCLLYAYCKSLSTWANELDQNGSCWEERASLLQERIEQQMWNEERGCWQDIKLTEGNGKHEFVDVLTPVIWFPAWLGVSENETRIRRVTEEHLLNEEEFFGLYPIPTVAYNSPYYNVEGDCYYWREQIWLVTAYSAVSTLAKYGYEEEYQELIQRLVGMMQGKGGIYETYNALTGEVGWGSGGPGEPSCFQFGWSAAFLMEIAVQDLIVI
jgi:glycogen debranching enzyme